MNIAVIGDYKSPKYLDLLMKVKIMQPDEQVFDLSRHKDGDWSKLLSERFSDISNAHRVFISSDWCNHFDAKRDITYAQSLHKECFIECDGKFLPLEQFMSRS
jgi:hypothetical protein